MANHNTYGSTNHVESGVTTQNGDAQTNERSTLLNNKQTPNTPYWRAYLNADIERDKADLVLLFSYITTGLLDSTATAVWGSFVSMQTGNTIYLGLGLADPSGGTRWIKSGTSILSFCVGSFLFSRYHRAFSAKRRWVLISAVFVQLLCIIGAAAIVTFVSGSPPGKGDDKLYWHVLVPLALVAFQSSGQAVISRALKYNALTSVVLTSIYCDLFSDAQLFAGITQNAERNRRTAAPLLLLVGAVLGGVWSKTDTGMLGALWMAAALKFVVMVTWIFWPAEKEDEE